MKKEMKKILLLLCLVGLFLNTQAQVTVSTAPDFTITDHAGDTHTLYDYLDDGKYVMIDFFAFWCGPCCTNTPNVGEVYTKYGCNTQDLIVLAIELEGTVAQVEDFEATCGGGIAPVVVGSQDGNGVHVAFGATYMPTLILIAPDGEVVNQDIWPFSVPVFDGLAAQYGIAESDCNATAAPTAEFSSLSEDLEVQFTNSSTDAIAYLWDFGDGNTSTEENPIHTYSEEGTYTVCLTVINSDEIEDTSCEEITVTAAEVGAAQASFTYLLSQNEVTFSNNSSNSEEYAWDFGDGNTSTEENPTHAYAASGFYNVCLTASNSGGSNEVCQTVNVSLSGIEDFIAESIELFPNPTKDGSQLRFELNNSQEISIIIYDVIGSKVSELNAENYTAGSHSVSLPVNDLEGGQYFISLVQGAEVVKVLKLQKVD